MRSTATSATSQRINTPYATPLRCNEQEDKTVEHSQFAIILERQQSMSSMSDPVRKCHLAAGYEGCPVCEQANHYQNASYQLNRPSYIGDKRRNSFGHTSGEIEQLLAAMP
jgi:hypothetical protein